MRLHKSLQLKQNLSRAKSPQITSVTPKEAPITYFVHNALSAGDKQMLQNKLAYEWKNIYRSMIAANAESGTRERLSSSDFVALRDFEEVCQKFRVHFSRDELSKIQRLFAANASSKHVVGEGAQFSIRQAINFVAMSHLLGLHRASYAHMGAHTLANQRSRSIYKLQQLYKSIEPVEEEHPRQDDAANDYGGQQKAE